MRKSIPWRGEVKSHNLPFFLTNHNILLMKNTRLKPNHNCLWLGDHKLLTDFYLLNFSITKTQIMLHLHIHLQGSKSNEWEIGKGSSIKQHNMSRPISLYLHLSVYMHKLCRLEKKKKGNILNLFVRACRGGVWDSPGSLLLNVKLRMLQKVYKRENNIGLNNSLF